MWPVKKSKTMRSCMEKQLPEKRETTMISTNNQPDRLSELPEPIMHHIMSFLPYEDAARTSALSKKFKSSWTSFPIICFDGSFMFLQSRDTGKSCLNYVSQFLHRRTPNVSLQKFSLHVTLDDIIEADVHKDLNEAINFVLENQVKELDIDLVGRNILPTVSYSLPLPVLSGKSIRVLKLNGFKFECKDVILSCPFVEDLSLQRCVGMSTLKVSCDELKSVEVDFCSGLEKIEMDASKLESFSYIGAISMTGELDQIPIEINIAANKLLKYLSLKNARIRDVWFESEVPKFPLLEVLKLAGCRSLKNLIVSSASLKTMLLRSVFGLERVKVAALNLESFSYVGSNSCEIDIKACKSLKEITLYNAGITDRWLESNVAEFASLENVNLFECGKLENFKISHKQLKSFQLIECKKLEEVEIDARKLASFVYTGGIKPLRLLVDSMRLNAKLSLKEDSISSYSFLRLRNLLSSFGHCKELQLDCKSVELLIAPKDLRESLISPLCDLKHMKVLINSELGKLGELIDSLLWLAPRLDAISIVLDSKEKSLKFEYAMPGAKETDQFCCSSRPIKCWRHYLKEVTMENFGPNEKMILLKFFKENAVRLQAIYDKEKTPAE